MILEFFGRIYLKDEKTASQRGGNNWFFRRFASPWQAPHIKKVTKCMTNPQSPSTMPLNDHLGQRHDNVATTTAANEGIFTFPNTPGRGGPFLLLYLPYWTGNEPVSSIYCCPGTLILSFLYAGNDHRDAIGSYQWHFDACKYCFFKEPTENV